MAKLITVIWMYTMQFKLLTFLILCSSLAACGGGSSSSSEKKNSAPVVNAGTDQQIQELASVTLSAQASDDGTIASVLWTQISGSTVALSTNNSLTTLFTAPLTSVVTELSFRITATDNQGVSSSDVVNITINPTIDNPNINIGSDKTVDEDTLVTLTATATDTHGIASQAWTQTSGPNITLNASTSLAVNFTAPSVVTNTVIILQLTVTDNRGSISQDQVSITVRPGPGNISGIIKYENVPHTASNALDYANSTFDPVRGVDVELLDSTTLATTPVVIASTKTNSLGEFSFNGIVSGQSVVVRAKSTYVKTAATNEASWDMQVIDNTNGNAIYAIDSASFVIVTGDTTKNMTALSGWDSAENDFTSPRAAAPFHILDRAYDMVTKIVAADSDVILPEVKINWSIKNAPSSEGSLENGFIGTSYYSNNNVYILGLKDSDTDEYDGHVILHELGHYFEDKLSRADSIGGSHSSGDRLDMRVAFGEGFGNAWSGIITDDSYYRDSSGNNQGAGFSINVEYNPITSDNSGWYSEDSVQSILYDIYDANNETGDSIELGFAPIYNILIGAQKVTPALTSIFSFTTSLKAENTAASADIDALLAAQNIVGDTMDIYGSTETNNASNANVLPIYTTVSADGVASNELCSIADFSPGQAGNKLSTFRFIKFLADDSLNYTFTVTPSGAGAAESDPIVFAYRNGTQLGEIDSFAPGSSESFTLSNTSAGHYIFAVSHYPNYAGEDTQATGCFTFSAEQN